MLIWSSQLSSALVYLHDSKILHRDLKSQNIFLTSPQLAESSTSPHNTIIKLGDFGISRPLETTCDLASTCVGTPAYMAPEVCHRNLYSYPCDMWSLGCVLVEMCSLKPAFQGTGMLSSCNCLTQLKSDVLYLNRRMPKSNSVLQTENTFFKPEKPNLSNNFAFFDVFSDSKTLKNC